MIPGSGEDGLKTVEKAESGCCNGTQEEEELLRRLKYSLPITPW
jgi:hypothetical protein